MHETLFQNAIKILQTICQKRVKGLEKIGTAWFIYNCLFVIVLI